MTTQFECKLRYPYITAAGQQIASVTMRRATVRDLKIMERYGSTPAEQEAGVIAALCDLVPEDIDAMDMADYRLLQDNFRDQLGLGANPAG